MSYKKTVLVAEENINTKKMLNGILNASDYNVIFSAPGSETITFTASHVPDFLIINTENNVSGETIKAIREWSNVPIIAISETNKESEIIEILDAGADDYITIPFGHGELLARMRAILRRNRLNFDEIKNITHYKCNDLNIDFDRYEVSVRGKNIHLTANEFKIIELLAKYSGKILTYEYILKQIWGPYAKKDNKALRVNMANLRHKIELDSANPEYLFTEPGVGYKIKESQ